MPANDHSPRNSLSTSPETPQAAYDLYLCGPACLQVADSPDQPNHADFPFSVRLDGLTSLSLCAAPKSLPPRALLTLWLPHSLEKLRRQKKNESISLSRLLTHSSSQPLSVLGRDGERGFKHPQWGRIILVPASNPPSPRSPDAWGHARGLVRLRIRKETKKRKKEDEELYTFAMRGLRKKRKAVSELFLTRQPRTALNPCDENASCS